VQKTDLEWLVVEWEVWSQLTRPRLYGRARIRWDSMSRPSLARPSGLEVQWLLQSEEIERIERDHAQVSDPGAPWRFNLLVRGLATGGGGVVAVAGNGQLEIAASDWGGLVEGLRYGPPPGSTESLRVPALDDPSWASATDRLNGARKALRAGEGREALGRCLDAFEAVATRPYAADSWRDRGWALPDQKLAGIVQMLAGHCLYLNKVGHHRDRVRLANEHLAMPLDQWEAELAVDASHLYLAYALRLDAIANRTRIPG
jgi:hypothetical protein